MKLSDQPQCSATVTQPCAATAFQEYAQEKTSSVKYVVQNVLMVCTVYSREPCGTKLHNLQLTRGSYTSGHLKFKAIQDFSRLFEKDIQDCFNNICTFKHCK